MRQLYSILFRLFGWTVNGHLPALRKYIIAIAPHTSNWDFVVGVAARSVLRLQQAKFLGKSQLFRPPYGWIFHALGGYPVDRTARQDMVKHVANLFNTHDEFILALAPEGTRRKVEKLRTGFYYIAKAASVPIVPVGFDFKKKAVIVGEPLYPGQSIDEDFQKLHTFYSRITAKNPELGIT